MDESSLKNKARGIKMLVLDVDGTLTDSGVYIDSNGIQSKRFNIKDGMGINLLQHAGIKVGLISNSRMQTIIEERARMLDIKHIYSGNESKLDVLKIWMQELTLEINEIAYIGDDVNDLEIMSLAGLSACPADAHYKVIRDVDIVLQRKGGEGCVREFIDRFLLGD